MIRNLFSIVNKNFRILARSKLSLISIILVPVLVILLTGFAFNSSGLNQVNVGIYSESYSDLTNEIVSEFEMQNYTINRLNSTEQCSEDVKQGFSQICIVFPKDLSDKGDSEEILFYVDHSRINLAYILINEVNSKISAKSSDVGVSLAQNLIDALESAKNAVPGCKIDTDLSKSNIKLINKKAVHNISLESINNVSALLNSASDLTNSSSAEKKITEALALLEALNTSNIQATSNLDIINNQSTATLLILQELSNKLDILIADLGSANVVGADKIVSPIGTKIESITTSSKNKDYIIPALIAIIALFGGILLSSTFVLQERKSKAYFRKFLTPTSDFTFLFGSYLTCLIILVVQFVLVLIGIAFILNTPLAGILPQIALILFLALSAFTFIGMFIGYLFKSEETTIFAGVLISALLMFFSNTLLPLETMSEKFRSAALFNPLVAVDTGLKKVMLFGLDLSSIANELYILAGFFVVFAVLSYFGRRITKKML